MAKTRGGFFVDIKDTIQYYLAMSSALQTVITPKISIEVKTVDDLFNVLLVWGEFLGQATKKADASPPQMSFGDYVFCQTEAAQCIGALWDQADQQGWSNIFSPNVISRKMLQPDYLTSLLQHGNGLWGRSITLAANVLRHYPGLVWDTERLPQVITAAHVVDNYENDEALLDIILGRLELKPDSNRGDPNFPARHRACTAKLAQALLERLSRSEQNYAETDARWAKIQPGSSRYVMPAESDLIKNPTERALADRLSAGEEIPEMAALICVRLLYKNATIKWVGDSIVRAQIQLQKQEQRASALVNVVQEKTVSSPPVVTVTYAGPPRQR